MRARVVGMHCESGDILVSQLDLPSDIKRGDILAIQHRSLWPHDASNYNQALRRPSWRFSAHRRVDV